MTAISFDPQGQLADLRRLLRNRRFRREPTRPPLRRRNGSYRNQLAAALRAYKPSIPRSRDRTADSRSQAQLAAENASATQLSGGWFKSGSRRSLERADAVEANQESSRSNSISFARIAENEENRRLRAQAADTSSASIAPVRESEMTEWTRDYGTFRRCIRTRCRRRKSQHCCESRAPPGRRTVPLLDPPIPAQRPFALTGGDYGLWSGGGPGDRLRTDCASRVLGYEFQDRRRGREPARVAGALGGAADVLEGRAPAQPVAAVDVRSRT